MQLDLLHLLEASEPRPDVAVPTNLAEAWACYDNAVSDHPRRAQIRSSFKTVARALRLPLDQVSADPAKLRVQLKQASAAMAGVKPRAWTTAKSVTLAGLRDVGVAIRPSRDCGTISGAWTTLLGAIVDRGPRIGLPRFLRFLTREGVEPADVTAGHFEAYLRDLQAGSIRNDPEASHRQTIRHWNACVRAVEGWPQLTVSLPGDTRRYSLDWEDFPTSFRQDVQKFLEAKRNPDPLEEGYTRKVRGDTDAGREGTLRRIASALVLSTVVPASDVTNLAVLTNIENVRAALRYLKEARFAGEYSPDMVNLAELLRTVAKHWEQDSTKADAIRLMINQVRLAMDRPSGLTPKNRLRLEQFNNAKNVDLLVGLPNRTLRAARREPGAHRQATRVMYALQVGILLSAPIRLKNLNELAIGKSLIESGSGRSRQVRVHFTGDDTKTHTNYSAPLSPHIYPVLDAWIANWRPIVCDQPSTLLFPNSKGQLRSRDSMSAKLTQFVRRETGLTVNTHLFRSLAAKIYLAHDPDGLEVVRQLLGHTSIKTTLKAYAELQTDPAFRRLEEALHNAGRAATGARRRPGKGQ